MRCRRPPSFPAPDPRDVDPRAVRRAFARAAATYDAAAALQREVGARMAQRLDYVKLAPALDPRRAAAAPARRSASSASRYPGARVVALDLALPMVASGARARAAGALAPAAPPCRGPRARTGAAACVCGDLNALPLRGVAFDLVWSNLALQWVNDVPRAFAEWRRVLKVGGLVSFTTFGPGHAARDPQGVRRAPTATRTPTASSTCTTWATCWCTRALPIR